MKNDPVLFKKIGKNKLYIHSSHQLPNYLENFPFYDRALPRICKKIKEIDGKLEVIDVGANIGDTVSLISQKVNGSFLCVEGDEKYLPLLKKNINFLKDDSIEIEENYCAESILGDIFVDNKNGTARLTLEGNKSENKISNFKSLDCIIKEHPKFKKANLLKIDTDGYEINVLKSGKEFIRNTCPIIFLEFTPSAYEDLNQNYEDLLKFLIDCGYDKVLFYDNFGIPVCLNNLGNFEDIKKLVSKIDSKNTYYYDLLVINKKNQDKYMNLFYFELIGHIQESNSIYRNLLNNSNQYKIKLLEEKAKTSALSSNLLIMQNTKLWKFSEKIRFFLKIIFPKNSLQRTFLKKTYHLYLYIFQYLPMLFKIRIKNFIKFLNTDTNRQSKKIVYIGHSYHEKTKSTTFLINYLRESFDVKVVLDETWQGKDPPNLDFIDESYLGVIFFQRIYPSEVINKIKNKNIIFFPMYDGGGNLSAEYWKQYNNVKFINFSKTLHHKLIGFNLNSIYVQYFPKPKDFVKGDKNRIFFWQRITDININTVEKLLNNKNNLKIHLHRAIDPEHQFVQPTKDQELKFSITYSDWFKNKEDSLKFIKKAAIYMAPRKHEGIGLSFLEAMAMGKAVVAMDNPTMNEYISNNKNGYLFNENNSELILKDVNRIQRNTYQYMKSGYRKWMKNRKNIINFIIS